LYGSNGNGNGVVWAIPESQAVPLPEDCERLEDVFLGPPRPRGALDDFMEAIEGAGNPQSYLFASILARELREFGAMWHGLWWDDVLVLAGPAGGPADAEPGYWTWDNPCPDHFGPFFEMADGLPQITLHLFSYMGEEQVFRAVDTFQPAGYCFETAYTHLARGQSGAVY